MGIEEPHADSPSFWAGRGLEDGASVIVRYRGAARALHHCSRMATGERNGPVPGVYGGKKSITWAQETPEYLEARDLNRMSSFLRKGGPCLRDRVRAAVGLALGHPEGPVEAFANLYLSIF